MVNNKFHQATLDELETLVDIPSETGFEHEMLRYLDDRFQGMGLVTDYQPVIQDRYNLVVNPQDNPLIITAHTDTVPEILEGRKCYRYTKGDLVYGRGAADTKGGIAALIMAVESFLQNERMENKNLPFTLVFTVDEEKEGAGAEIMAESMNGKGAIVLEPTELNVGVAQAGSIEVLIKVFGNPAHGGQWDLVENAVKRTIRIINELDKLPFVNDYDDLLGPGGFNMQWLKGGQKHALIVPSRCEAVLDFRVLPDQDVEEIKDVLETFLGNYGLVDVEFMEFSPSFRVPSEEPMVQLMCKAVETSIGEKTNVQGFKSWTDAEPLYGAGITPVIFGPGSLTLGHTPHEHININDVVSASNVLKETIRRATNHIQHI